jgi:hypothetical protein
VNLIGGRAKENTGNVRERAIRINQKEGGREENKRGIREVENGTNFATRIT